MSTVVAQGKRALVGAESGGTPWWVPKLVYGVWTLLVMAVWIVLSEVAYREGWYADLRYVQTAPVGRGDGYLMILLPAVIVWGVGAWMLSTSMLRWRDRLRTRH